MKLSQFATPLTKLFPICPANKIMVQFMVLL